MSSQHERCARPGRLTPFICAVDFHTSEGDLFGRPRRAARRSGQIISAYLNSDFFHSRPQSCFFPQVCVTASKRTGLLSDVAPRVFCTAAFKHEQGVPDFKEDGKCFCVVFFLCASAFFIFFLWPQHTEPPKGQGGNYYFRGGKYLFFAFPCKSFPFPRNRSCIPTQY